MTITELKQKCSSDCHFFDKDTVKFWGSKVCSRVFKNNCFVTSEDNFNRTERLYSIRRFTGDSIETIGEFQAYKTKEEAIKALKQVE